MTGRRTGSALAKSHTLPSRAKATLPAKTALTLRLAGKTVATWHASFTTKTKTLKLALPIKAREAGSYTLTLNAAVCSDASKHATRTQTAQNHRGQQACVIAPARRCRHATRYIRCASNIRDHGCSTMNDWLVAARFLGWLGGGSFG